MTEPELAGYVYQPPTRLEETAWQAGLGSDWLRAEVERRPRP